MIIGKSARCIARQRETKPAQRDFLREFEKADHVIRAPGKRKLVKLGIIETLAPRQVPSPRSFAAAPKVKDRRLLEVTLRRTAVLGIFKDGLTAPDEIGRDAAIHGMQGRHSYTRPPDRKPVRDQPLAQAGNEVANMVAGDSLLYNPLNMIANFRTST